MILIDPTCGDDPTAEHVASGPMSIMLWRHEWSFVMLDDDDGISHVAQTEQRFQQPLVVTLMQDQSKARRERRTPTRELPI